MLKIAESPTTMQSALERLGLAGHEDQWADRYVLCNHLVDPLEAKPRQKFEAAGRFIRDLVAHRWAKTRRAREKPNPNASTTCRWSFYWVGRCATI